tara:strand:- start:361 stop:558 length:198 start_codon:yes stop_codon:yes gene_type:complete
MITLEYDGRLFEQLINLKKEIKTLLLTIEAITNDMTLKGINIDQQKRLESDVNSYYKELRKLDLD